MGGRSSSFRHKSGGGIIRQIKASKKESDYSGTAYSRVNEMLRGNDSGELTAHIGNGHSIYTFSTTDYGKTNDFTSEGTKSVYQLTKTIGGWHIGRIAGDLRQGTVYVGQSKIPSGATDFKTLSELKSKDNYISQKSLNQVSRAMKDYKRRH